MSAPLTIVARIVAKPEKIDLVKTELLKLLAPTRDESGCLRYDLHQDNKNPAVFLFYETWANPESLQEHINRAHFTAYTKATEGAVDSFTVNEMTKL